MTDQNPVKLLKMLIYVHIKTVLSKDSNFEKIRRSTADLTCKWKHQDFFGRNFSSQRTYISNSTYVCDTYTAEGISFEKHGHMWHIVLTSIQIRRRRRRRILYSAIIGQGKNWRICLPILSLPIIYSIGTYFDNVVHKLSTLRCYYNKTW